MVPAILIWKISRGIRRRVPISAHPVAQARANLYRLMDQTAESHQPITISGKRHDVVLLAADDWQAIQETLYLLSVPGMRESIKEGMAEPLEASNKELDW
jgi:antitoxin YefM